MWHILESILLKFSIKLDVPHLFCVTPILENIDKMIAEKEYRKQFFYHKVVLSNMQIHIRKTNKNKDYWTWQIDETKKLVEAL